MIPALVVIACCASTAARGRRGPFPGKRLHLIANSVWSIWVADFGIVDELIVSSNLSPRVLNPVFYAVATK